MVSEKSFEMRQSLKNDKKGLQRSWVYTIRSLGSKFWVVVQSD